VPDAVPSPDAPVAPDPVVPRVVPELTPENVHFWTGGRDGRLLILRCGACGRWVHPPAARCPGCDDELHPEPVSGNGTIFTYTVDRHAYNPAVPLPYVIALVELVEQEGLRVLTDIVQCDPDTVTVGMPVHVVFEQHDEAYVPLFAPD
jgi:uncharacterized OB-fold protein